MLICALGREQCPLPGRMGAFFNSGFALFRTCRFSFYPHCNCNTIILSTCTDTAETLFFVSKKRGRRVEQTKNDVGLSNTNKNAYIGRYCNWWHLLLMVTNV